MKTMATRGEDHEDHDKSDVQKDDDVIPSLTQLMVGFCGRR